MRARPKGRSRVDAAPVERVVAVADAQEARRLLKGLGPRPVTSSNCCRLRKAPCRVAPAHDAGRHAGREPDTRESRALEEV